MELASKRAATVSWKHGNMHGRRDPWVDCETCMSPILFEVEGTYCVVPLLFEVEIKIVAARCQIITLKFIKFDFGWVSDCR